ncbi:MAG: trehalose-6-phosphate synthase, partial [Rhodothermales bacterium]|nr:trehalose-6-phosphate synthase [Rhodothermales bacterium]
LVTALEPVLRERGGVWVGWPGIERGRIQNLDAVLSRATEGVGYEVKGVNLSPRQRDDFYLGFANQVIWPLFHDLLDQCNFEPRFWQTYEEVNRKFARVLAREIREGDFVWVHDYHLMSVGAELRERGVEQRLGFFLHIPFPPLDLFVTLPWRFQILKGLLSFDLVGFQSARDRKNFVQCVRHMVPEVAISSTEARVCRLKVGRRTVRAGVFPVSIAFEEFAGAAASDEVSERVAGLRSEFLGRTMILGVDRLDYSKGIPHKLQGFRVALRRYPELRERVSLVQLVVPSREDIPEYDRMKSEIERLVGRIQGEFTRGGWVPIHYQYGRWNRTELVAHYRAAGVALVTPLKDGMNLVAKEFCASSLEGKGVLILSEYAGATAQLQENVLLVNPHDVEGVSKAIHRAVTMEPGRRRSMMEKLRSVVREQDIFWWVDTFLKAARDEDLGASAGVETFRAVARDGYFDRL